MDTSLTATTYLKDYKPSAFVIESVNLEFSLQADCTIVSSDLTIIKKHAEARELCLDGVDLELLEIQMDGRELRHDEYEVREESLIIHAMPCHCVLHIVTRIYPDKNTRLTGLYKTGQQYCSQCEAEGFRRITYFLDRPDIMSLYSTKIIADKKHFPILLSNGNKIEEGDLEDGRHWVTWADPFKKPCYLFAIVAGNFDLLEDRFKTASGRLVQLKIYVEPGDREKSRHAMRALKKAMVWDEKNYQREYDLDLYMIVAVRDFNAGAMENKGLNIFNAQYILAEPNIATDDDYLNIESVIAHEYFHNWTGNRITCRDWFQLSLKEGLTIFREQSFTEDTFSKAVARIRTVTNLRSRQFPEDAGPLSHAVQPHSYIDISNFYSSTIYNKGAEIVRMLKTILGKKDFYDGMRWYFENYDGQAITTEEFIHAFEVVSGKDLTRFRRWYTQSGTPLLQIADSYDAEKMQYTLHVKQEHTPGAHQLHKECLHIPLNFALYYENGEAVPLKQKGCKAAMSAVLPIRESIQSFVFHKVASKPVPSLLRGFSAPVKLQYNYDDAQLETLLNYDTDPFNKWEASQVHAHNSLEKIICQVQRGEPLNCSKDFIHNFNKILLSTLESRGSDKYFVAEMLTLPSEKLLAEKMEVINYQAIHQAREAVTRDIAENMQETFLEVYHANHNPAAADDFSIEAMASRRLKNLCLFYLLTLPDAKYLSLAQEQFRLSLDKNMTDTLGALRCLVNINHEVQQEALSAFYEKWKQVPQVVDKWLGQQALSKLPDTLKQVKMQLKHPAFAWTNPNQVYALIGTFTQQNHNLFHAPSGEGYIFLREAVVHLNRQNPILASALVKPLLEWRRYDKRKQKFMRNQLDIILEEPDISRALYEVVEAGKY